MDSITDEEELLSKQRKERKELQAKVMALKKSVSKGDKKKKKEVTEEIAKLEASLNVQHEKELAELKDSNKSSEDQGDSDPVSKEIASPNEEGRGNVDGEEGEEEEENAASGNQGQRKSKAQKRREKKETNDKEREQPIQDQEVERRNGPHQKEKDKKQSKDKEREQRIQEQEVENRKGPRQKEMVAVLKILKDKGLSLHEIPADGNCMYAAIGHQLALRNSEIDKDVESLCQELREKTSGFMMKHPDDFLPFMTNDSDDIMTLDEFSAYCDKMTRSFMWGGQLELRAMSEVLDVPIQVLQADTQPLVIGDTKEGSPITVVYHRHAYRLGEHYNSVLPRKDDQDDDDDDGGGGGGADVHKAQNDGS